MSSTIAGAADLLFETGQVSGSTGCNRLMGSYTVEGSGPVGSISFADIATTMKLCEPDVAEQERVILMALDTAAGYSIEGSTMSLADARRCVPHVARRSLRQSAIELGPPKAAGPRRRCAV